MTLGVVIKAFHNRNPVLREEPLVNPWGQEYSMVNEPFLEVELEALLHDGYPAYILRAKPPVKGLDGLQLLRVRVD